MLKSLRGRASELQALLTAAEAARAAPQLVMMSGPRRVGKSFLLQHLLAELPDDVVPIYFEATQAGEADQLRRFAAALGEAFGPEAPPFGVATSWEQALSTVAYLARNRPLVVVLDEASYLTTSTPGFASTVKSVWDSLVARADAPQLMLVMTGSAIGLMEDMLAHSGPLYGRPTLTMRLRPFTAAEASRFCGSPDPTTLFEAYAACGGYPLHLDAWDFEKPTETNLLRLAGRPGGLLLEDAELLLTSLPDNHRRVLIAVGQGRAKRSEIDNEVGGRADRPLESLVRSRCIQTALPVNAPAKARPEFRIEDAYLRFWFRMLASSVQRVEAGQGAAVLRHGAEQWQGHLGWSFEQAARDHAVVMVQRGELPPETLVGEWWTASGTPVQIDVIGIADHRTLMVGEAKWSGRPLGSHEVDEVATKARLAPRPVAQPQLLLWGRGGVRPEVQVGTVRGFGAAEMLAD